MRNPIVLDKKTTCYNCALAGACNEFTYRPDPPTDDEEAPTTFLLVLDGEPEAASLSAAWLELGVPVVEIKRV